MGFFHAKRCRDPQGLQHLFYILFLPSVLQALHRRSARLHDSGICFTDLRYCTGHITTILWGVVWGGILLVVVV